MFKGYRIGEVLNREALKISLISDVREIAVAAAQIDEFCAARNLAPAIAYAVNLSVDELLTNTISYGYEDGDRHRIDITVRMDGSVMVVEITDDGMPFDPSGARKPDTEASLEDRPIGGLGVFLVHRMMDSFQYRRSRGHNIVTLTKNTTDVAESGT